MVGRSFIGASTLVVGIAALSLVAWQSHLRQERSGADRRRLTSPVAFDRGLWLRETEARIGDEANWRNRMADDVAGRWIRPGATRSEVIRLLGPGQPLAEAEYRSWTADSDALRNRDPHPGGKPILAYWTFFRSEDDRDSGATEYLYVFFDARGRVVRSDQGIAM